MIFYEKWYQRTGAVALAAMLISMMVFSAGCTDEDEIVSVTILQTSDVHHRASGFGPQAEYTPLDTSDSDTITGGYARLAALVNQIRDEREAEGVPVLLVDSGDFLMGTIYDMTVTNPLGFAYMNVLGYDAVTLGNHEFDWAPAGLAMLLSNALAADPAFGVPIVASNMVFSADSADDDALEAFFDDGTISNKLVLELDNGLKVGLFGLMGEDADSEAPLAPPVTFDHTPQLVQNTVSDLRDNDGVDLVVALSHSGLNKDLETGEDIDLAQMEGLVGLDVIASGHTHLATPEIIDEEGTLIFQPGEYGNWLARVDIRYNLTKGEMVEYVFELIPIDDTIEGDDTIQGMVDSAHAAIDPLLEAAIGVSSLDPVAELSFNLDREPLTETGIGNLCADAARNVASADVGVLPNGVIRDSLHHGADNQSTFSDLFNVLPLGMSPDAANQANPVPGWPLVVVELYPYEIRNVCEVSASIAASLGDDTYLNYAGMRCEYDPTSVELFHSVNKVTLCNDPFSTDCPAENELDISYEEGEDGNEGVDETPYVVVSDLYTLLMMEQVASVMTLVPKHVGGGGEEVDLTDPEDYMKTRLDGDPGTEGIQEVPSWLALFMNVQGLPAGEVLPEVPESVYGAEGTGLGRITVAE